LRVFKKEANGTCHMIHGFAAVADLVLGLPSTGRHDKEVREL